ncbi:SDR family oxidoreductase [Sphingobacterium rhinopitheci]|uniref:SDR family oxidoreductase n=1 Tax=Sphingobacterium rhinopitheci TaxID=2781960 RepID=UPI001F52510C|nr:SDR family oxidoreductase [Sphingobacterium rhinopitheci]MCI0921141.1 SDR family oxidoreductase [Sphingobacterium rhinopitheci]
MEIKLQGKKALVGGSSAGIGLAVAIELAKCGASIVLMARNEDKLKDAINLLDISQGQLHTYIVTDFNDYDKHKAIISSFFETNTVDILVNNTNGPIAGDITTKVEADYELAFNLLFQNAVFTSNLALIAMKKKGFGRIINISSMTVKEPQDTLVLSNTMRTALVSWSKSLSNAVAADGITVNTVLTGSFDTDRLNSLMSLQADKQGVSLNDIKSQRITSIPVQRLGEPKEYGYLVSFLASEYASFLTGTSIPLDGGSAKTIF